MTSDIDIDRLRAEIAAIVMEMAPEPVDGVDVVTASFVDDLDYHSVALVELGFAIEERYVLEPITAEDVEDVQTTDDLVRFVAGRLGIEVS